MKCVSFWYSKNKASTPRTKAIYLSTFQATFKFLSSCGTLSCQQSKEGKHYLPPPSAKVAVHVWQAIAEHSNQYLTPVIYTAL